MPSAKRKRVSFGPSLSPEHFDKYLPPKTPVKKGATPSRKSEGRRSLLKTADNIGTPVKSPAGKPKTPSKSPKSPKVSQSKSPKSPKASQSKSPKKTPVRERSLSPASLRSLRLLRGHIEEDVG